MAYDPINPTPPAQVAIVLDKGLDFSTPKSFAEPGTLLDVLNYEHADVSGLYRSNGFLRTDGAARFEDDNVYYFRASVDASGHAFDPTEYGGVDTIRPGAYLFDAVSGEQFGILFAISADSLTTPTYYEVYYFKINSAAEPTLNSYARVQGVDPLDFQMQVSSIIRPWKNNDNEGNFFDIAGNDFYPKGFSTEHARSPNNCVSYINSFFTYYTEISYNANGPRGFATKGALSPASTSTPNRPVVATTTFKDYHYCAVDCETVVIDFLTNELRAGEIIKFDGDEILFQIVNVRLLQGSWSGASENDVAILDIRQLTNYTAAATLTDSRCAATNGAGFAAIPGTNVLLNRAANVSVALVKDVTALYTTQTYLDEYKASKALLYRSYDEVQSTQSKRIVGFTIVDGGTGYVVPPAVRITGGGGAGATAYADIDGVGSVSKVCLTSQGFGYTSQPTITFVGTGSGADATAIFADWSHSGWHEQNVGWKIKYNKGSSSSDYLTTVDRKKSKTGQTVGLTSGTTAVDSTGSPSAPTIAYQGHPAIPTTPSFNQPTTFTSTTFAATDIRASDTSYAKTYLRSEMANLSTSVGNWGCLNFTGVRGALPTNAKITGIKLTVNYNYLNASNVNQTTIFTGTPSIWQMKAKLFKRTFQPDTITFQDATLGDVKIFNLPTSGTGATMTATFGGTTDLWGQTGLTDSYFDENFGVVLDFFIHKGSSSTTFDFYPSLNEVYIEVSYQAPTVRYYFTNSLLSSNNIISADLVSYTVDSGSFSGNDATGSMYLGHLSQYKQSSSVSMQNIRTGWSIYADDALTVKVGEVTEDMSVAGMDCREDLVDSESQYRIISANFYANEDFEGIYGVSGAGRAFYFDGVYFSRIHAYSDEQENAEQLDKPRHLVVYKNRLALGYKSGEVQISKVRSPENFSGFEGAITFGVGDRITGLKLLQGDYLGVFCENSIHGFAGSELRALVPNSGAIEYTVESMGDAIVYVGPAGIRTLSQSDKYGDFAGIPISLPINPWLRNRLSTKYSAFSNGNASGIVTSFVVRRKNQYRVWFKDGYQLVMYWDQDNPPKFSFVRLMQAPMGVDELGASQPIYPIGVSSVVDKNGAERILFAIDFQSCNPTTTELTVDSAPGYVYEMDRFWGHDNGVRPVSMESYIILNHYFKENPFQRHDLKKVRIECASRGVGVVSVSTSKNYEEDPFDYPQKGNLYKATDYYIDTDQHAESTIVSTAETDRNILIKIENFAEDNQGTEGVGVTIHRSKYPEPPHYLQLLLLQLTEGKQDF